MRRSIAILSVALSVACTQPAPPPAAAVAAGPAESEINATSLVAHLRLLASDAFEGRAPATRGGQLTVEYLASELAALGLQPAGDNGTFFQQVLVIANTTRRVDPLLIEAALTMGSRNLRLIRRVVVPAVLPQLYRDQRILIGWAWTYLIVAELIGTSSGITFFITQQARYQHFDNVYAAILVIGFIGIATDIALALLGRRLFPYARAEA